MSASGRVRRREGDGQARREVAFGQTAQSIAKRRDDGLAGLCRLGLFVRADGAIRLCGSISGDSPHASLAPNARLPALRIENPEFE
jgi:hypothetical protein